ncbi:uncharacterized protein LOC142775323 [Rhipicephalus microplus]|uniref:uncharacterized protein LOC142775323 n=1 Tax=Rhipicephalus microplus TaxID=6941 RepID=UPI003F6C7AF1
MRPTGAKELQAQQIRFRPSSRHGLYRDLTSHNAVSVGHVRLEGGLKHSGTMASSYEKHKFVSWPRELSVDAITSTKKGAIKIASAPLGGCVCSVEDEEASSVSRAARAGRCSVARAIPAAGRPCAQNLIGGFTSLLFGASHVRSQRCRTPEVSGALSSVPATVTMLCVSDSPSSATFRSGLGSGLLVLPRLIDDLPVPVHQPDNVDPNSLQW